MEHRPWGWFLLVFKCYSFWLKIIHVEGRTSNQIHRFRDELHLSLAGIRYVPRLTPHRMTKGNYLEVAWGVPREDDIIRLEDDYGRV